MNRQVKLSIIVVTYDRPNEVLRAIESCRTKIISNYEIIIWDNHSSEKNREIVKKYCDEAGLNIRYFYSDSNLGAGGGKNEAWKQSHGQYVFIMDDDAVIYSDNYFSRLIEYMDQNQMAGIAYTDIFEPETGKHYDCKYTHVNEEGRLEALYFVGGAHIIRKESFPQKNLYPTRFKFGGEELYASFLVWESGKKIHKVSDLVVHHLPTAINRHLGKDRDRAFIIASYIVKKMTYPLCLQWGLYLLMRAHLFKNGITYDFDCKNTIKSAYNQAEISRMTLSCFIGLTKKFGIRSFI